VHEGQTIKNFEFEIYDTKCHAELVSASKSVALEILKQVQDDVPETILSWHQARFQHDATGKQETVSVE